MSTPVSTCQFIAAAKGDEKVFEHLVEAMDYNLSWGMFTIFPCDHKPPCEQPTDEQKAAFEARLDAAIKERRRKAMERSPLKGKVPKFDKFIFPVIKSMSSVPSISDIFKK